MYAVFDNLNAIIVGMVVILTIMFMQTRMNEVSIEQTANYMVKQQAINLAMWLEDDLLRMGRGMNTSLEVPFKDPDVNGGVTTGFTFYRDTTNVDLVRISTRYVLEQVGTHYIEGDTVASYRLERYVCEMTGPVKCPDGGPWVKDGESSALLGHFTVDMLDRDSQPVSNPVANAGSVRNTRVRFSMVTPFERQRSTLRRVHYGSTLMIRN